MTRRSRAIAPLLGLGAAILLFLVSRDLDRFAQGGQLGPGLWPRLALVGLGAACLAKVLLERRTQPDARAATRPPLAPATLVSAVALLLGYVLATPTVGFPLATAGFVAAFMWLAGSRSAPALAAGAVVGPVVLLYVFVKLVYLPLPKGAGAFEALTVGLYRFLRIF